MSWSSKLTSTLRMSTRTTLIVLAVLVAFVSAWAQSTGGFFGPGELASPHADLSGITSCTQCHDMGAGVSATKCMACHDRVREQVSEGKGFHADKGKTCESCHPDHRGADFPLVRLEEEKFDHSKTGFDLEGAHAKTDCAECHTEEGVWSGASSACVDCHEEPHGAATGRPLLRDCEACHGVANWDALPLPVFTFDHGDATQADYALHGRHVAVPCADCHADWKFTPVAHEGCADCHDDLHNRQFSPRACEDCHTVDVKAFALRSFDHTTTDWPLVGNHKKAACEDCHQDGARAHYVDLPHDRCETCHKDPHEGQFKPRDCDACHAATAPSFGAAGFDHNTTDFPLRGAHQEASCEGCHGEGPSGTYAGLVATGCASCHEDAHAGRFAPATCESCHEDGVWEVSTFDHTVTGYALDGAHAEVTCAACHGLGEDRVACLPHAACSDCHASDSPHEGTAATATCESCHRTAAWSAVTFDHATTGFALEGKHQPLACTDCHTGPSFVGAAATCTSCHEDDKPPQHFEGACETCHAPAGWRPATLGGRDHAVTGFPLTGVHTTLECGACHTPGTTTLGPFCQDCHGDEDPHRNLAGNTCESCHSATDWSTIRFLHASTGWPLRGPHHLAACVDCHATGFVGTPTACVRCHQAERPGDALHADPLARECETCHRPYSWEAPTWPHGD